MRTAAVVGGVVALAGLAGALAFLALSDAPDGPSDRVSPPDGAEDGTGGGGASSKPPRTRSDPDPADAPDAADPPPPAERDDPLPPPPELSAAPEPGAGVVVPCAGFDGALAAADWHRVGDAARKVLETSARLARDVPRGISVASRIEAQSEAHRTYLETLAPALPHLGMQPGYRPEFGFSHPVLQANAIGAALRACGRPLSTEQAVRVREAAEAAAKASAEDPPPPPRPDGEPSGEDYLGRLLAATESRRAFRDAVAGILDASQRRAAFPAAFADRMTLDPFSPALSWSHRLETIAVDPEARWTDVAVLRLAGTRAFDGAEKQMGAVRDAAKAWFDERGVGPFVRRKGELARNGYLTLDEVESVARTTQSLIGHLAEHGGLTPVQVARLRSLDVALLVERVP